MLSLWVYAERPDGLKLDDNPLERLPLATVDREIRTRALPWAVQTLTFAASLEAKLVVVPLSSPEVKAPRGKRLDAARATLEVLSEEAARYGVHLALLTAEEDAFVPNEKELLSFFSEFSGAPLGYWHQGTQEEPKEEEIPQESLSKGGIWLLAPPIEPPKREPAPLWKPPVPASLRPFLLGTELQVKDLEEAKALIEEKEKKEEVFVLWK